MEKTSIDDLGSCKKVQISKENTTIIDGKGDQKASRSKSRPESERKLEKPPRIMTATSHTRELLKARERGVAVIKVGAAAEVEMKEKSSGWAMHLHSTRAAVEEGVVPGGGVAMTLEKQEAAKGDNQDQQMV